MRRLLEGGEIDGPAVTLKEAVVSIRNMPDVAVRAT
jgi:hypothetical protein